METAILVAVIALGALLGFRGFGRSVSGSLAGATTTLHEEVHPLTDALRDGTWPQRAALDLKNGLQNTAAPPPFSIVRRDGKEYLVGRDGRLVEIAPVPDTNHSSVGDALDRRAALAGLENTFVGATEWVNWNGVMQSLGLAPSEQAEARARERVRAALEMVLDGQSGAALWENLNGSRLALFNNPNDAQLQWEAQQQLSNLEALAHRVQSLWDYLPQKPPPAPQFPVSDSDSITVEDFDRRAHQAYATIGHFIIALSPASSITIPSDSDAALLGERAIQTLDATGAPVPGTH